VRGKLHAWPFFLDKPECWRTRAEEAPKDWSPKRMMLGVADSVAGSYEPIAMRAEARARAGGRAPAWCGSYGNSALLY